MADKKIFDLIPESLKETLIEEIQEILQERTNSKQQQQGKPLTDPIFDKPDQSGKVDPLITAYAQKFKKK